MNFILKARTNKVGSESETEFEVDDEEALNPDGTINEAKVDEVAREFLANIIEWNWQAES
jgi:hypothetical protein